ncbi:MAG: hypothetical protein EOP83_27145 [Verrucomicrobiaceae bacterium]|nr:MAG: hypothetical protein EOP83_27145 [Verrucomicrobiaceae bacterium]
MNSLLHRIPALFLALVLPVLAAPPREGETIASGVTRTGGGIRPEDRASFRAALDIASFYQPIITDGSLSISKTSGLQTALNTKLTVFNIQNYGAIPNDGIDDTAACQAATAAAKAVKGRIYGPTGTYNTSGIAFMLDWEGAEIFGDGCPDRGIAGAGGTTFAHSSLTRPCIMVPADYNDVRMRDFRVSGQVTTLPALKTFTVDASTDVFTSTSHGYQTGDMLMVESTGTLPSSPLHGLSKSRMYFCIRWLYRIHTRLFSFLSHDLLCSHCFSAGSSTVSTLYIILDQKSFILSILSRCRCAQ